MPNLLYSNFDSLLVEYLGSPLGANPNRISKYNETLPLWLWNVGSSSHEILISKKVHKLAWNIMVGNRKGKGRVRIKID